VGCTVAPRIIITLSDNSEVVKTDASNTTILVLVVRLSDFMTA